MNKRTLIASIILILAILACNLPAGNPTQSPSAPVVTETSALPLDTPIPTLTSLPTDTPFPSLTPTPTIPIARPLDKGVNCRLGPGIEWVTIAGLLVDQTATIQGKNGDASWWYVTTPNDPGKPCWVAASVTLTSGNLANLPVIPLPLASVTNVSIKLDPKEIDLTPLCAGPVPPITIKGIIETNGPVKVKYYFETEQGGKLPVDSIEFKEAGSKNIEFTYSPPAGGGTYWVRLIIVSPNDKVGEAKYKIKC